MSDREFSRDVKLPVFKGRADDWRMWSAKFVSFATFKDFDGILLGKEKVPTEENDPNYKKMRKLNNYGFYCLNYAIECKVCFNIIDSCRTENLPEGDCCRAWKMLKDKFEPSQAGTKQNLLMEFHQKRLTSLKKSPDEYLSELEYIRYRLMSMNEKITDNAMINHILCSLPEEYDAKVEHLQNKIDENIELSLNTVMEALRTKFNLIQQRKKTSNNMNEDETPALFANNQQSRGRKQFKGVCRICGKYGHKAEDCWHNEKNKEKNSQKNSQQNPNNNGMNNNNYNSNTDRYEAKIKCFYCNKIGHRAKDCRKKKRDQERKEKENGNGMVANHEDKKDEETDSEWEEDFCMMARAEKINNYNGPEETWFADSGATVHITNNDVGMFNIRKCKFKITVGDGHSIECEKTGDLKVLVKQHDKFTPLLLRNVRYVPTFSCNLFSLTTALAQPKVIITAKEKNMVLQKGDLRIKFKEIARNANGFMLGMKVVRKVEQDYGLSTNYSSSDQQKKLVRFQENPNVIEATAKAPRKTVNSTRFHNVLGHACEDTTRLTAKTYGISLTDKFLPCEFCAKARRAQLRLGREASNTATKCGGRMFLDVTTVNHPSLGGSRYLAGLTDEFSHKKFPIFLKNKNDLQEMLKETLLQIYSLHGVKVEIIRMDNAGENLHIQEMILNHHLLHRMGTKIEFTAPFTPQQNGKIERVFPTMFARARACFNAAKFDINLRKQLWAEAISYAFQTDDITVTRGRPLGPPYRVFCKKDPTYVYHLRSFGEVGICRDGQYRSRHEYQGVNKHLLNRGKVGIFVGYLPNHPPGTWKFYDPCTKKIFKSRDVTWLEKTYGEYTKNINAPNFSVIVPDSDEDLQDELSLGSISTSSSESTNQDNLVDRTPNQEEENVFEVGRDEPTDDSTQTTTYTPPMTRSATRNQRLGPLTRSMTPGSMSTTLTRSINNITNRLNRELRMLETDPRRDVAMYTYTTATTNYRVREFHPTDYALVTALTSSVRAPKRFKSSWDHGNEKERLLWREAILKELQDMNRRSVFEIMKIKNINSTRTLVGNKWVFTIKRDGRHRARIVALGYTQIPGVDFTENFSPVVHDITFRLMLVLAIVYKYEILVLDVETAFLHGDLDEEIYMSLPAGYHLLPENEKLLRGMGYDGPIEKAKDHFCARLGKGLYGLVQAARQWYKKFVSELKRIGFITGDVDPCLLYRRDINGLCILIIYVDDCMCLGDNKAVFQAIEDIKKLFKIKISYELDDYLGCKILRNHSTTFIHQPHIYDHLKEKFLPIITRPSGQLKIYTTPGTPNYRVLRTQPDDATLSNEQQKIYRSGVGILLYLVKHSRPDLSNPTRELSKVMDKATLGHWKELLRVITYTITTETKGLLLQPTSNLRKLHLHILVDAEFAGDADNRKSIMGRLLYLNQALIGWCSKGMTGVTLSTTEAEYVSMSEGVKDLKFVHMCLTYLGFTVELPMSVYIDNIGAIDMLHNQSTKARTKHVDIRFHWIRNFEEEGYIKVIFKRSENNTSDVMTKNVSKRIFDVHEPNLVQNYDEKLLIQKNRKGFVEYNNLSKTEK